MPPKNRSKHLGRPLPGVVDVWTIPLDRPDLVDGEPVLSPTERERADRRAGLARRRFVARHVALRSIIAAYEYARPASVPVHAPYGARPRCKSGIHLTLSHAGPLGLAAVGAAPVGVDIERLEALPADEAEDVAGFVLADAELEVLRSLPPQTWREVVLRAWTRKEAYLKLCGDGLSDRVLAGIELSTGVAPAAVLRADGADVDGVALVDLDPAPGYLGAVAVTGPVGAVAWHAAPPVERRDVA